LGPLRRVVCPSGHPIVVDCVTIMTRRLPASSLPVSLLGDVPGPIGGPVAHPLTLLTVRDHAAKSAIPASQLG